MSRMQWQLGVLGTISAFAYRHREIKKILCQGGNSAHHLQMESQWSASHPGYCAWEKELLAAVEQGTGWAPDPAWPF